MNLTQHQMRYRFPQARKRASKDVTERIPVIAVTESEPPTLLPVASMIPCGIRTDRGFTCESFLKIADIYTKDGTHYYVLTHKYLGGKLYRKPDDVCLQATSKQVIKKAS